VVLERHPFFDALLDLDRAFKDADNLLKIHLEEKARGRRWARTSLNRAMVVLAVAAWQAFCERLATQGVQALKPSDAGLMPEWRLLGARMNNAIYRFATPNAENTQALLIGLGYDPWPDWNLTIDGEAISQERTQRTLNEWLKVRHAIAHGAGVLPDVQVLRKPDGSLRLWRVDAEACMAFIKQLAEATYNGVHTWFKAL